MEMKKQKKIIGGMILVLAVTACASFLNRRQKKLHRKKRQKYIKMK